MKILMGIVGIIAMGAVITAIYLFSGNMNIAATATDLPIIHWVLENTRVNAVRKQSEGIRVPDLLSEDRIAVGGKAYDGMCVSCHSAPGKQALLGAKDMNPPPPDLTDILSKRSPEEVFWVIKNGVRMTGMPAWGNTHNDKQIWDMVAFINRMPELTSIKYASLISSVKDDGHDHDHGSNTSDHHGEEVAGSSHHDEAKTHRTDTIEATTEKNKSNHHDDHDHAH